MMPAGDSGGSAMNTCTRSYESRRSAPPVTLTASRASVATSADCRRPHSARGGPNEAVKSSSPEEAMIETQRMRATKQGSPMHHSSGVRRTPSPSREHGDRRR
jgi:hypothetical protein